MVVERPANYDEPQTVNDQLMIPPLVGQEVELEPVALGVILDLMVI